MVEEHAVRQESPRTGEDATAISSRERRKRLAEEKHFQENEEKQARGPKVGNYVYFFEVQKRLDSRLLLALGTEGKKRFMQKNPHVEISKLAFKNIIEMVKFAFQKVKSVTYERSKLISRAQQSGETLEAFHAALTAQAARSELGTLGGVNW